MPHNKTISKYGPCRSCHSVLEFNSPDCPSRGHQYLHGLDPDHPGGALEPPEPYGVYERQELPTQDSAQPSSNLPRRQDEEGFYKNMVEQLTQFNQTHPYPPVDPNRWIPFSEVPHTHVPLTQHEPLAEAQDVESSSLPIRSRKRKQQKASPVASPILQRPPPTPCTNPACPIKHTPHTEGLYFHSGVRPSFKDPVWGFSSPPPYVREALRRVQEGRGRDGDGDAVRGFIGIHGIEMGRRGLGKRSE